MAEPIDRPSVSDVLAIRGLRVSFPMRHGGRREVVRGVDLTIGEGECVALVGESGCGKTTLGRSIVGLVEKEAGSILLNGEDADTHRGRGVHSVRRCVQMVFQDAAGSLDPRMRIGDSVAEPLVVQRVGDRRTRGQRAAEALALVGLSSELVGRYPHELSGGQRQRVGIARALVVGPQLVILDEPVSALDVSVQAQVVNLLASVRADLGVAFLFISHDLAVVRHLADRVAVMSDGVIVEVAPTERLFKTPTHPQTVTLLEAGLGR